ncbi:MAG: RrF2 family transcriptional regulator [Candidatus Bipolaricaulaceae bacterium]
MFTQSAKYVILALVKLASRGPTATAKIQELAEAADIPYPFLAKLVPMLVRAGILTSVRGKQGGISFARPPTKITLAELIRLVEGDRFLASCPFSLTPCRGQEACPLYPIWDPVRDRISEFLATTSVAVVAAQLAAGPAADG